MEHFIEHFMVCNALARGRGGVVIPPVTKEFVDIKHCPNNTLGRGHGGVVSAAACHARDRGLLPALSIQISKKHNIIFVLK